MYCICRLRVEDCRFINETFKELPDEIKGNLKERKSIVNGEAKVVSKYWISESHILENTSVKEILFSLKELLLKYRQYLLPNNYAPSLSIYIKYSNLSEAGGLFLDADIIHMLSEIHSNVDIDEYIDEYIDE